ncbi:mandelate racemase/muconate lactonizing enzyme family protein [Variovorax saccharolyticus]|uniref:mandelate racemase/muconate lactonizing enzyme family protein n=1 Tax=Variovorax saccharolyticus TaxID=3053516 RepID=UPI0025755EF3|nr:enolase C-terminal domain-like protein [Variovorax sp. J31P216]MDM0029937.1 enolase C-terminal domain-like protein [Variovorax sp. J31P216]
MPAIQSVETLVVQLPTRREHRWTGLNEPIGRYLLVKLTDDAGNVGWGEAPALKDWGGEYQRYFGESTATTELVVSRYLSKAIIGVDVRNIVEVHARMDSVLKGYPYAKAAVEFAVYDAAARSLNVPVYTLLGGSVRKRIPVTHSLGLISVADAEAEAAKVVSEGIKTIKIKIGVDPKRDVEVVRAVRSAVGSKAEICVDANEGYETAGLAIQTLRKMEQYDLKYAEQLVMGIEKLAQVAAAVDVPVMADESAWNAHDVIQIVERKAAQIVSIYTTKPGGLYRAMEVAAVARAAGLICNVNGSVETGVGNRANVHLAAAAPAVTLSCVVPVSTNAVDLDGRSGGIYYTDDLLKQSMTFNDGAIEVPDGPGFGIDVDEAKVDKYRISN